MPQTTEHIDQTGQRWTVSSLTGFDGEVLETIAFEERGRDGRHIYVWGGDNHAEDVAIFAEGIAQRPSMPSFANVSRNRETGIVTVYHYDDEDDR